jgi:hypothetical protein
MHPSALFVSSGIFRRLLLASVAIGACVAAVVLVASAAAAPSPTSRACPSAAVVNAALGQHGGAPVVTKTAYSKTCTYPGSAIGSTKITFQVDTAATFAAGEKSAGSFGAKITKVKGLGKAAWTTGSGDLYVFDGHEQIKILALALGVRSPSTATAKVAALAHKLL